MPKEVIHDCLPFGGDGPEVGIVEVSWGRETEHVQLATVLAHTATHELLTREVEGGWYVNLDRRAINDLIRKLRRARDQAFGRDE